MNNLWKILTDLRRSISRATPIAGHGIRTETTELGTRIIAVREDSMAGNRPHPFKIWTRNFETYSQFRVAQSDSDTETVAGRVKLPDGSILEVAASDWLTSGKAFSEKSYAYLQIICANTGVITGTVYGCSGSEPASSFSDNPFIVNVILGEIGENGLVSRQHVSSEISLVGSLIPQWYANFVSGKEQFLGKTNGNANGRLPKWLDFGNGLKVDQQNHSLGVYLSDMMTLEVVVGVSPRWPNGGGNMEGIDVTFGKLVLQMGNSGEIKLVIKETRTVNR